MCVCLCVCVCVCVSVSVSVSVCLPVSENIALLAVPADRASDDLLSAFPIPSFLLNSGALQINGLSASSLPSAAVSSSSSSSSP